MDAKHTPPPWRIGRKVGRFINDTDDKAICEVDSSVDGGTREQDAANAGLWRIFLAYMFRMSYI
jgi:hypothetical protein